MHSKINETCPKCGEKVFTLRKNDYWFTPSLCPKCKGNRKKINSNQVRTLEEIDKPKVFVKKRER